MTSKKTDMIDVPGARLYYELYGEPTDTTRPLLMIPGGLGDAAFFSSAGPALGTDRLVVAYDRRGNSRSILTSENADLSVPRNADDAIALLDALGIDRADVFGGSGGAVIALDVAARYPDRVATMVSHEPPVVALLPDGAALHAELEEVHAIYRTEGAEQAMEAFQASYAGGDEQDFVFDPELPADPAIGTRFMGNVDVLLGRELLTFVEFEPDLDALKAAATSGTRLLFGGGVLSKAHYPSRSGAALADLLGAEFVDFPGDHAGYLGRPRAFADRLREVLAAG
ncbi:alpha/beta fold hydrolase [Actinopolymorpha pittospori]|uniref:Pimeloyl-ACP methyl ester carboxylesterase n=1 Tax=Actinopolymorpha pittospori TaxID=648752 RepID=A0A927MSL1_9ACTN|nr:alpha/beta hydrolase [Actinopolymorpha pittospori]MBE1605542.1 pimeloyl-ACP methyl ester carboxylesterase [Actinopolymorpha pittospori]